MTSPNTSDTNLRAIIDLLILALARALDNSNQAAPETGPRPRNGLHAVAGSKPVTANGLADGAR